MIKKILLAGDNLALADSVYRELMILNQQIHVDFISLQDQANYDIKANEVVITLCEHDNTGLDAGVRNNNSTLAYVCAKPNPQIMDYFSDVHTIGTQRHLLSNKEHNNITLGDLKNNISLSEPIIRSGSVFIFDMNAIRASDLNHSSFSFPSGLHSEDATQMFRYAGLNELNRTVEIHHSSEEHSKLLAQFIWYYAEAAAIRVPDHPYFTNTVHEYVVNMAELDLSISFYKSKSSGRWWVKIPDIKENKWKPCSYQDYLDACEGDLSHSLLNIISISE